MFDVLEDTPEFFVARGNTGADIVLLALVLTLVPPTAMVACEAALAALPRARRLLHLTFVGALVAALALQIVGDWFGGAWVVAVVVSLAVGAAAAVGYDRLEAIPTTLTVLSPAPAVFLVMFLALSPVSKLLGDEGDAGARAAGDLRSAPVVMVVFDEFASVSLMRPDGEIDAERFPAFARLAREATWYRNATTVADQTTQAVPAMLTGRRGDADRLPILADHPNNLFTALGDRYRFQVHEPVTDLCPAALCGDETSESAGARREALLDDLFVVQQHLLLPESLHDRLPAVDRSFRDFGDEGDDAAPGPDGDIDAMAKAGLRNRIGQFERFERGVASQADGKTISFAHFSLPHAPWEYLPSGQSYPVSGPDIPALTGDDWGGEDWLVTQAEQRYLLQLGLVDRQVSRLVRALRERGLYDRAMIVVTADHGVSFQPNGRRRVAGTDNLAEIAGVPLFVKTPGQRTGGIDDGPATTADIVPTILRELGLRSPVPLDGRPLPRPPSPGATVRTSAWGRGEAELPLERFVRDRDALARARGRLFGSGWDDLFAAGPAPAIVGRPVEALPAAPRGDLRVELDFREEYADFRPGTAAVPAFVTGRVTGGRGGERVAIAVNGRVAAVSRAYRAGDEVRVGAMVSPAAYRAGSNRVEAFAVTGTGAGLRLAPAGRAERGRIRLVERDGGVAVVGLGAGAIPVEPGNADGYVDTVEVDGGQLRVAGWATSPDHGASADRVLLFAEGRLLQAAEATLERPDLAQQLGVGAGTAGYEFSGIAADDSLTAPGRLKVIAVSGGRASELPDGS
jgi:sulfatase-like protein